MNFLGTVAVRDVARRRRCVPRVVPLKPDHSSTSPPADLRRLSSSPPSHDSPPSCASPPSPAAAFGPWFPPLVTSWAASDGFSSGVSECSTLASALALAQPVPSLPGTSAASLGAAAAAAALPPSLGTDCSGSGGSLNRSSSGEWQQRQQQRMMTSASTRTTPAGEQTAQGAATDEERRRLLNRLLYRSKQRGFLELDLLLGKWAEDNVARLDDRALKDLAVVLDEETPDLFKWITSQEQPPPHVADNTVLVALQLQVSQRLADHASNDVRAPAGAPWVRGWEDFAKPAANSGINSSNSSSSSSSGSSGSSGRPRPVGLPPAGNQ